MVIIETINNKFNDTEIIIQSFNKNNENEIDL